MSVTSIEDWYLECLQEDVTLWSIKKARQDTLHHANNELPPGVQVEEEGTGTTCGHFNPWIPRYLGTLGMYKDVLAQFDAMKGYCLF